MIFFLIIVILGVVGTIWAGVWAWISEAQDRYDMMIEKIVDEFNGYKNSENYFEKMRKCIEEANDSEYIVLYRFPEFIVKKVKIKHQIVSDMIKELFEKLYSDVTGMCENKSMSKSLQYICNLIELEDSFKYIKNVKIHSNISKEHILTIQKCFQMVQAEIDDEFHKIANGFLENATYSSVSSSIEQLIETNQNFVSTFSEYNYKPADSSQKIEFMEKVCAKVKELEKTTSSYDGCCMVADNNYGKCEQAFFESVNSMNMDHVDHMVKQYYTSFEKGSFEKILDVNLKDLAKFVWFCAMSKPFSVEKFEKASRLYNGFFKEVYTPEILLAEIYSVKQMGGDKIIREKIDDLLDEKSGKIRRAIKYNVVIESVGENKSDLIYVLCDIYRGYKLNSYISLNKNADYYKKAQKILEGYTSTVKEAIDYDQASNIVYALKRAGAFAKIEYHHNSSNELLTTIASGLMWIEAYDCEKQILEYMLSKNLPMGQKMQERLHSLNNGGGEAPKGYDVISDSAGFYFDISSVSWSDKEYEGFFENLNFQEKILSYSVAVREEDNERIRAYTHIKLPDQDIILGKIKQKLYDEYEDAATASIYNCIAMSGNIQEQLNGILVCSSECEHMGILVYINRIGKRYAVKFYTLYIPVAKTLKEQKQQLLSLYKKTPKVYMWEKSLKDTLISVIESLCNDPDVQSFTNVNLNPIEF